MKTDALERLAARVEDWSGSLWQMTGPGVGGFRMSRQIGVNLFSSTDLAWILYAMNRMEWVGDHKAPWIRYLQSQQDPATGRFRYDAAAGGHSEGHAFWHTPQRAAVALRLGRARNALLQDHRPHVSG